MDDVLPDQAAGVSANSISRAFVQRYVDWYDGARETVPSAFHSLNAGSAGSAYALLRMSHASGDRDLLVLADALIDQTVQEVARMRVPEGVEEIARTASVYHSPAGVHFVDALLKNAVRDRERRDHAVERMIEHLVTPTPSLDITLGQSSALLALDVVLREATELPPALAGRLTDLARLISHHVHNAVANMEPSAYEGPLALNFAHGWGGVLYALVKTAPHFIAVDDDMLQAKLSAVASFAREADGGGLTWPSPAEGWGSASWCNGSAGMVSTWLAAHRRYGTPLYLHVAEEAAFHAGQRVNPRIHHLCCGMAGQAYALLAVFEHTREDMWLERARELAEHCAHALGTFPLTDPEAREGLYKGEAGVVVLFESLRCDARFQLPFIDD